ncbi:hypothetical protein NK214_01215 [Chromobacterium sp. S0633]|uniref:hypothetical protein n=1 Tax=Chromobacterium sp. S0633 TaxID=2957805 RepID=UPI00209FF0C5|nr:hypothetical protein [Chromobacterium sp. S0633]MCP1288800.1 hypothetical protein [Chromobacterium sp. S0633]
MDYETVFAQYKIDHLFLVVLENDFWEGTNYLFYLLDEDFHVVDRINLSATPEDNGFIQEHHLQGNGLIFYKYKSGKRYELSVQKEGRVSYSLNELKHRSCFGFMRPKKYLTLRDWGAASRKC